MAIRPANGAPAPAAAQPQAAPAPQQSGGIQASRVPQTQAPQQAAPATTSANNDVSWADTGAVAAAKSQQVVQQAEQRKQEAQARGYWPMRFKVKNEIGNNQAEIIILDAEPGPRYYEHMVRNRRTGFDSDPEPCAREFDTCPLCPPQGSKEPYYVMLLTVLDLRGYWSKKKNMHVPVSKNLLAVKSSQHGFFDRLYQRHGTLRGVQLMMTREGGQFSSSIGTPEYMDKHSDQDIVDFVQRSGLWVPIKNKDGKVVADEAHMTRPFEYGRFLHKPDAERLRRLYGGSAPMGSEQYNNQEWQGDGGMQHDPGQAAQPVQSVASPEAADATGGVTATTPAPNGGGINPTVQQGQTGPQGAAYELDDDIPF